MFCGHNKDGVVSLELGAPGGEGAAGEGLRGLLEMDWLDGMAPWGGTGRGG